WLATPVSAPSPSAEPPRSFTTTLAPSVAASSEISRPMPRPAPVTTMTLPSTHLATTILPLPALRQPLRARRQSGERVGVRGGHLRQRRNVPPPLTLTLSPF